MRYGKTLAAALIIAATPLLGYAKLDVRQGHPVVHGVYVNGHGPYRFLLDTGAQVNHIHAGLARSLDLRPTFQVDLVTITGSARTPGTGGLEVELDSARAGQQEFLFTDLVAVRQLGSDIQGVLGQAFLSRFDYLLDLRGKRLEFGAVQRPGTRVDFQIIDGRPAVFTSLGSLVLDSGTDRLILYSRVVRAKPLLIEGRTLRYEEAVTVPRQPAAAEDGLLPATLFRSVYVCNSEGYVVLD